jgi:hypothetical protein
VILSDFGIFLISLIGFPPLPLPTHSPAVTTAIRLSPITGLTNEEHQTATHGPAKQLSEWHFARHCTPAEWTMAVRRGKLKVSGVSALVATRTTMKKTPTVTAVGVFASLRSGS